MEGINAMPRDEYYRRLGVAVRKVGQRLLRKADEYGSLSRRHENSGCNEEAMDAFFMDIAYQTAHYGMIKRYEEIRDKGTNKPLFTLTAEEMEIIRRALCLLSNDMASYGPSMNKYVKFYYEGANNLLTRIKQWHNENNRTD